MVNQSEYAPIAPGDTVRVNSPSGLPIGEQFVVSRVRKTIYGTILIKDNDYAYGLDRCSLISRKDEPCIEL